MPSIRPLTDAFSCAGRGDTARSPRGPPPAGRIRSITAATTTIPKVAIAPTRTISRAFRTAFDGERSAWSSRYQRIAAARSPTRTPVPSREKNDSTSDGTWLSPEMTTSKTTTARTAAVTSLTIPSVSSAAATRSRTGTTSKIGVITVGPVAMSSDATRNDSPHDASSARRTTTAVATRTRPPA